MSEQAVVQEKVATTETGKVISTKMNKTIVVLVVRQIRHPKYNKYIKRNTKLYAHDENNECKEGDVVKIQQSRPLSKKKTWRLVEIIETTNN